jgi:uncharacterized protein
VAETFSGFVGSEVLPPEPGQREWTTVYRFESTAKLEAWLASDTRHVLLDQGSDLFQDAATQRIIVADPTEPGVAVVVSHPVSPDKEDQFLAWQQQMTDAERAYPGFLGSEIVRPVPGIQDDWTIVYRFDSTEHLEQWLESPDRQRLLAEGHDFSTFELQRISGPFGSWFSFGNAADDTNEPPSWKTALSVLVGLYPTVVLLTLGISELWPSAQLWESLLLGNVLSVALLTWVVMPLVTRVQRFWLLPAPGAPEPRTAILGTAVSLIFLTAAAAVFWLVTTVIWTLP